MSTVIFPYAYIPDPTKGKPISNGQLFFGLPDLDPEIEANRITVGLQQEDGTVVPIAPAAQPILTGAGGVPLYNGSPAIIVLDDSIEEFSLKVLDKNNAQVYYNENVETWLTNSALDPFKPIESDLELTIGAGGDYSTINEALDFLSVKNHQNNIRATLRQLSGFVMQEQVFVDGMDLSWITIASDDAIVDISRAALTETYPDLDFDSTPAFLAINGGILPVINTLYSMDTSGVADSAKQHGVMCAWGGKAVISRDAGIDDCTGRGLYAVNGSIYARNTFFRNAGVYGCRFGNGSIGNIRGSDFSGAGDNGIHLNSCIVSAIGAIATGCTNSSLDVRGGAVVNASQADLSGSDNAIFIEGGFINAEDANLSGSNNDCIDGSGGEVRAENADMSDSGDRCLSLNGTVKVNANGADMTNCGGIMVSAFNNAIANINASTNTPGQNTVNIGGGGQVNAGAVNCTFSDRPNKLTDDGIIYSSIYVTENSGTAQILTGTSTIVVAHGLSYTPTIDQFNVVTNSTNGAAEGVTRVINVDATNFTIGINQAASNDINYFWRVIP